MAPTIASLAETQATILERLNNTRGDVESKHKQNRSDIHAMRNDIQDLTHEIWMLKLKVAGYSGLGSAIVLAVFKGIELLTQHSK